MFRHAETVSAPLVVVAMLPVPTEELPVGGGVGMSLLLQRSVEQQQVLELSIVLQPYPEPNAMIFVLCVRIQSRCNNAKRSWENSHGHRRSRTMTPLRLPNRLRPEMIPVLQRSAQKSARKPLDWKSCNMKLPIRNKTLPVLCWSPAIRKIVTDDSPARLRSVSVSVTVKARFRKC